MEHKQRAVLFGQIHARWFFFGADLKILLLVVKDFAPAVQICSTIDELLPQSTHLSTDQYTLPNSIVNFPRHEHRHYFTDKQCLSVKVLQSMFLRLAKTMTPDVKEANI